MRRLIERLRADDRGITITELSVSMIITSLLSTVMITWVFAGFGSDSTHSSYDDALNDLRAATDNLSREVRAASAVTVADADALTFWLDIDRDDVVDTGETVTWSITAEGHVVRSTDADTSEIVATRISAAKSTFTYDTESPDTVTRLTIDLVGLAETAAGGDEVHHRFDVYLRNA